MAEELSRDTLYERAEHAARTINARAGGADVRVALVLGSGLGAFADDLDDATAIPYAEIPGFARSTVEGHAGRLVVGKIENVVVAAMQGRFHFYEGYAALSGPSYETPAEIRMLRALGADAVGMSTVPEAIVARHMGIKVLGISCITNMAAGVLPKPLNHEEVMEVAREVRGRFATLLEGIIGRL